MRTQLLIGSLELDAILIVLMNTRNYVKIALNRKMGCVFYFEQRKSVQLMTTMRTNHWLGHLPVVVPSQVWQVFFSFNFIFLNFTLIKTYRCVLLKKVVCIEVNEEAVYLGCHFV